MELRLTFHAERRMVAATLGRSDVEQIIQRATRTVIGQTAVEYDAEVRGVLYRVITVRDSNPPLVITVFRVEVQR